MIETNMANLVQIHYGESSKIQTPLPSTLQAAIVPFHSYLWKIASRCNLACSYCYIYNSADTTWQNQPHLMSEATARRIATRMRDHLQAHGKDDLVLTLHGGEPLLGGLPHLKMLLGVVDEELLSHGLKVTLSMQSNLTLLTEEIADLLLSYNVRIGTSLDGPPSWNDVHRVDHVGRPTSAATERGLSILTALKYRSILSGILCVIDVDAPAKDVLKYLLSFKAPSIDFLFPLNNYDSLPKAKTFQQDASPYGDWLIEVFDEWWSLGAPRDVRIFNSILALACGMSSEVESLGIGVIDLVVIETDGSMEGLDSLKSTFHGAPQLMLNVFSHSFDNAAQHPKVRFRQQGASQLSTVCRACSLMSICGGGYLPHRYSAERGFDNPSVYCHDLAKLIQHIYAALTNAILPNGSRQNGDARVKVGN